MPSGACAVCGAPAGQQCAGCKVTYYCGREHQRAHWPQHRSECRPIILAHDEILGRHLVAARNIAAGELILRDSPVVLDNIYSESSGICSGPKMACLPMCLGCCKPADVSQPCAGCGWPLCSYQCELSPQHKLECALMKSRNYRANITDPSHKAPDYVCIAPLRLLLLPEEKRRKVFELQSHLESRRNTPLYDILKNNVATFIRDVLGMERFTEDEILTACGILDTNCFELKPHRDAMKIRGLYVLAAMMAHNCCPNTRHVFDDACNILAYATVDIRKGEHVTTTYTQTLWGTLARRAHLKRTKLFECNCQRCGDPAELGTFLGAIMCSRCSKGYVVSTAPLHDSAPWKCQECNHEMTAKQVEWGNQSLRKELEVTDKKGPQVLEEFLTKYKSLLHGTNGHVLQVKYALSQLYGQAEGYALEDLSDAQLERKVELAHELLDAIMILEPGQSRTRGLLLFELHAAMAMQAKQDFDAERITKERAEEVLSDAMSVLQEATDILRQEPDMEVILQQRLKAIAKSLDIQLDGNSELVPTKNKRLSRPPADGTDATLEDDA